MGRDNLCLWCLCLLLGLLMLVMSGITVRWIKAHVKGDKRFWGNDWVDQLAKRASLSQTQGPDPFFHVPVNHFRRQIELAYRDKWEARWQKDTTCRQTKLWLPSPHPSFATDLFRLSRQQFSLLARFITGHSFHRKHNCITGDVFYDECRLCSEDGSVESPFHLAYECPATFSVRWQYLSRDMSPIHYIIALHKHTIFHTLEHNNEHPLVTE